MRCNAFFDRGAILGSFRESHPLSPQCVRYVLTYSTVQHAARGGGLIQILICPKSKGRFTGREDDDRWQAGTPGHGDRFREDDRYRHHHEDDGHDREYDVQEDVDRGRGTNEVAREDVQGRGGKDRAFPPPR